MATLMAVGFPGSHFDSGDFGGALACLASSFNPATTRVVNSIFVGNSAGEGGAVAGFYHTVELYNSILWDNVATGEETAPINGQAKGDWTASYTCLEFLLETIPGEDPPEPGNYPGSLDADPHFVDILARDLNLETGSPCIDAGNNEAVPLWMITDFAGGLRFSDDPGTPDSGNGTAPVVDMGALEFQAQITATPHGAEIPAALNLHAAPNPFGVRTVIDVIVPQLAAGQKSTIPTGLIIKIFDVRGRLVRDLPMAGSGQHSVAWDGRDHMDRQVPAGTYFLRLHGSPDEATAKVQVIR